MQNIILGQDNRLTTGEEMIDQSDHTKILPAAPAELPPDTAFVPPLPNYTLAAVCPACDAPTVRRACKVRCERCGFMWDCGEL
jgi:hypothetical protein